MMTLQELADFAQGLLDAGHNPNGRIVLATQSTYPFENELTGICTRSDLAEEWMDGFDEEKDEPTGLESWQHVDDVLLCEGSQLGYGTREAWNAARKSI